LAIIWPISLLEWSPLRAKGMTWLIFLARNSLVNFSNFKLDPRILAGIQASGYKTPTPIQEQAIPYILQGLDLIGLAQTGTGKTAAFVLPLLQSLISGPKGQLRALILVPTRELAEQIHEAIRPLARETGLQSTTLYGGVNMMRQCQRLRRGVDIVIACPGRLLDHIQRRTIDLKQLQMLVLDEADQMFDFGFFPTIRKILQCLPKQRQSLLFSATMPKAIRGLAEEILSNPVAVQIGQLAPANTVAQKLYPVSEKLKAELLITLLQTNPIESALIFTRTKHRAQQLAGHLNTLGYRATSFQGNLSQSKRQFALNQFRNGTLKILVATDIAARGIDIAHVSHVINFDMPTTTEAYTHRIGRTGRASKLGAAFTLITQSDRQQVHALERQLKQSLEKCFVPTFDYQATQSTPGFILREEDSGGYRKQQRAPDARKKLNMMAINAKRPHTKRKSATASLQKSTKPFSYQANFSKKAVYNNPR
jgi:ATP-dependent RNA helicase RhlE